MSIDGWFTSPPCMVSRRISTKFGTDNMSGSEVGLAQAEFENSNWLPWKSWNVDFEVPLILAMKDWDFAVRPFEILNSFDPQFYCLSWIYDRHRGFHSNSKMMVACCKNLKAMAHTMKRTNKKYLWTLFLQKRKFLPIWDLFANQKLLSANWALS